jgi:hypothetical protein
MKNLKTLKMASLLFAATLAAGAASAQVHFEVPADLPIAKSMLTRAEVTADLVIWRASALAALANPGLGWVDTSTPEYARAVARYNYMRASPQFAVLTRELSQGGSPRLLVTSR